MPPSQSPPPLPPNLNFFPPTLFLSDYVAPKNLIQPDRESDALPERNPQPVKAKFPGAPQNQPGIRSANNESPRQESIKKGEQEKKWKEINFFSFPSCSFLDDLNKKQPGRQAAPPPKPNLIWPSRRGRRRRRKTTAREEGTARLGVR
uniref:Uncharacterized protein n=1 Tax=Oryza brachyantha TaxID=4533 RepID=J3M767_ORYBR